MRSSLNVSTSKSSGSKRRGRHIMLPYWDVKKRFGLAIAQQIMNEKRELEKAKPKNDTHVYWMEHPDAKGQEESW